MFTATVFVRRWSLQTFRYTRCAEIISFPKKYVLCNIINIIKYHQYLLTITSCDWQEPLAAHTCFAASSAGCFSSYYELEVQHAAFLRISKVSRQSLIQNWYTFLQFSHLGCFLLCHSFLQRQVRLALQMPQKSFRIIENPIRFLKMLRPIGWFVIVVQVDEITAAPAGSGGLYVGMSLQSGEASPDATGCQWFTKCKEKTPNFILTTVMMHRIHWCQEITKHPRREFDGWLVGGNRKALGSGQGQIYSRGTVREMGTEKMKGAKGAEGAKGAKGNAALYMRNAPALHMPSKLQCSVVEASNDLQTATK